MFIDELRFVLMYCIISLYFTDWNDAETALAYLFSGSFISFWELVKVGFVYFVY